MNDGLRLFKSTILKSLSAIFFLLTSSYFFLAYIPYTNFFLIKAPPYPWLNWFAQHHSLLYLAALAANFVEFSECRHRVLLRIALTLQVLMWIWLTFVHGLLGAGSDWKAYAWSVTVLVPLVLSHAARLRTTSVELTTDPPSFSYFNAIIAAAGVAILSAGGVAVHAYTNSSRSVITHGQMDLLGWMITAHLNMAVVAVSTLNLLLMLAAKFVRSNSAIRRWICLGGAIVLFSIAWFRFFQSSLSFNSWQLYVYAILFSVAMSCAGASVLWPLLDAYEAQRGTGRIFAKAVLGTIAAAFAVAALSVPTLIGGADWNSIIQCSFNAALWSVLTVAMYLVRPCRKRYTIYAIAAVTLVAGAIHAGLEFSSLAWAQALGNTPGDIEEAVHAYAGQNTSFGMVYNTLHPEPVRKCGGFCSVLRQCTNMGDTQAKRDLSLVPHLTRSAGPLPNIFLIVVDSLRPDYLGAYNSKVDFTPNLDQFARESVVMRNAFTSYAGTSLSEPSIFAGALLLHSHYPRPFRRQNSLLKLAEADDYRFFVTDDPVLRQVLDPSDSSVKLDKDKAWNEVELASAFRQLQPFLDRPADSDRPILFYTQPQNVHQGTANRLVEMEQEHWQYRPGFDKVTTYRVHDLDRAFGRMMTDLKARGMYDNSIIILTADHGDGLPDTVCQGHQIVICPEVLRVPLIFHLPEAMRREVVYDDHRVATPTDIVPSLYYLLGHRPVEHELVLGRPLFADTREELDGYRRQDVFFVSDARAAYGLLLDNARYMYVTYDSPQRSYFYDLSVDPDGRHDIVSPEIAQRANNRIVDYLFAIGKFYDYIPTGGRDGL